MANKKVSQLTSKPSVLVTDLFPIADPSTGQLYKTTISDLGTAIGSGVSSVNSLVGAVVLDTDDIQELVSPTNKWFTDTRARAALSASSPLAYNSGTGVFSIPAATSSQNGYLTSTDWTTFNSKQAALSGTGFVKISGTTISYDNSTYLTTSAAASTYLALAGGTLTGALNGTSATFTGDLTISSANPRLYFTDTDNNPDYFISNTDGTFTVYDVTNSTARFTIGTTGNATFANAITGGGSITGTALYSTGIISAGTSLSVGTTITAGSSITATKIILSGGTSPTGLYFGHTDKVVLANYTVGGGIDFETNGGNITMQLSSAGNLSTTGILSATGATLTGALSGTSATFSSTITSSRNDTGNISMTLSNAYINQGNLINFVHNSGGSTTNGYIGHGGDSSGNIVIINNGITALSLARATGAATFTNSVLVKKNGSDSANDALALVNAAGDRYFNWQLDSSGNLAGWRYSGSSFNQWLSVNYSSGNVGIGTTAPTAKLEVESKIKALNRDTTGFGNSSYELWAYNGSSVTYGGGMFQTNSTFAYQQIAANQTNIYAFQAGGMRLATGNAPIIFGTGNSDLDFSTERMRITSGGDVLIGTTTNVGQRMRIDWAGGAGKWGIKMDASDGGAANLIEFLTAGNPRGSITTNGTSVAYNTTSDYRLKEDLKPINGLEIVNRIKVYDYKWKSDNSRMDGVMAHELAEVLPYAVSGIKDGAEMQSVDYSKIVPVMVQAIKELKAELDTLKNK
jgi:hypothetical protein